MQLGVIGPTLTLRLPRADDAPALFALASDPEVTRWFSWGPYTDESQALAYIERLDGQRAEGTQLDLLIDHHDHGPIGITGISEISARDRRGIVGSWHGRDHWGTGANTESKSLLAYVAFALMGFERLGSYTNVAHTRSQRALEKLGFRDEGTLRAWHRHGDRQLDVKMWSVLRAEWPDSPLARIAPVRVEGEVPPAFRP